MQFWNHYFAGVEDVWCLLAVNVFLLVLVTARLIRAWSSKRIACLSNDESGATYMLPLVLTMPFYALLITMIIECTLMLTAKIGSVGAAYSAARAAAVWLPYENAMPKEAPDYTPLENRQNMVRLAAARAMFPYASGSTSHASDIPLDDFAGATANQQIAAFRAYSGNQKFDVEYLKRKFAYAYNSLTVEIRYLHPETGEEYGDKEVPAFNAKIQLTLRYEAPIHTYGIGRLFGERSQFGSHFVTPVVTTVMIENEGVKTTTVQPTRLLTHRHSLGIRYYEANSRSPSISVSTQSQNSHSVVSPDSRSSSPSQQLAPTNRYRGEESWQTSQQYPEIRGPHYHIYVTEDRISADGVSGSRGWTYVEDTRTGIVYRYQHASTGIERGVEFTSLPVNVSYAELQGNMYVEDFNPLTGMTPGTSMEISIGMGLGAVIQDGPNGSVLRGAQAGAVAGASIAESVISYSYAGTFSSLDASRYSPLWTRVHRDQVMIPSK